MSIEQLKEETQKAVKKAAKKILISNDLTVVVDNELIFLTGIFKNGFVIGFWSHSPWGTTRDKEQGWVIISDKMEVVSSCTTKTDGGTAGENFKDWRSEQKKEFGSATKLCEEFSNELIWKIGEC